MKHATEKHIESLGHQAHMLELMIGAGAEGALLHYLEAEARYLRSQERKLLEAFVPSCRCGCGLAIPEGRSLYATERCGNNTKQRAYRARQRGES